MICLIDNWYAYYYVDGFVMQMMNWETVQKDSEYSLLTQNDTCGFL
jgi:hypothetical protein